MSAPHPAHGAGRAHGFLCAADFKGFGAKTLELSTRIAPPLRDFGRHELAAKAGQILSRGGAEGAIECGHLQQL